MNKTIWLLSIFLLIVVLGMVVLYGASGHRVNLEDTENLKYILLIVLYLSTTINLIFYIYKKSELLRKIVIGVLALTLASFLYLLYEIFKVKIGDSAGLIPIGILLIVIFLDIRVLYHLLKQ
jgi:hypothetical protein